MKTVACCCLIVVMLSTGAVSAQVLLAPQTTGHVGFSSRWSPSTSSFSYLYGCPTLLNDFMSHTSTYFRSRYCFEGVMEFAINQTHHGANFPPSSMTANNFVAILKGLKIQQALNPGDLFPIHLFDLDDDMENGVISVHDYNRTINNNIYTLFQNIPPVNTSIDPIDVTEQLRRDLFGSGMGNITSGFYLSFSSEGDKIDLTDDSFYHRKVRFDVAGLCIEVFICTTPTPWPTRTPTVTPTPTPTHFATGTPTPISSSTPTPSPTPTFTPVAAPSVHIWMPSNHYLPNQLSACFVSFYNQPGLLLDVPLFVILDVYGQVFFAPEFSNFSYYVVDVPPYEASISVLDPFSWPADCGSAEDIRWYAALTDPSMTTVISNIDTFTFGWSE